MQWRRIDAEESCVDAPKYRSTKGMSMVSISPHCLETKNTESEKVMTIHSCRSRTISATFDTAPRHA